MIDTSKISEIAKNAKWYHTIKLTPEIETNGVYNHYQYLQYYKFPNSLEGLTALDIGTGDGFFAFEFEKRGAMAVTAIDTNRFDGSVAIKPSPSFEDSYAKKYDGIYRTNISFESIYKELGLLEPNLFLIASMILNSKVKYEQISIYDMSCDDQFDFVFCGDLIEHLKDPLGAAEKMRCLTKKLCIISLSSIPDGADNNKSLRYAGNVSGGSFFNFYPGTFREVLLASGFSSVKVVSTFGLNSKRSSNNKHAIFHCVP